MSKFHQSNYEYKISKVVHPVNLNPFKTPIITNQTYSSIPKVEITNTSFIQLSNGTTSRNSSHSPNLKWTTNYKYKPNGNKMSSSYLFTTSKEEYPNKMDTSKSHKPLISTEMSDASSFTKKYYHRRTGSNNSGIHNIFHDPIIDKGLFDSAYYKAPKISTYSIVSNTNDNLGYRLKSVQNIRLPKLNISEFNFQVRSRDSKIDKINALLIRLKDFDHNLSKELKNSYAMSNSNINQSELIDYEYEENTKNQSKKDILLKQIKEKKLRIKEQKVFYF